MITVRVDDVPMARADKGQRRLVDVLAGAVRILAACELQQLRDGTGSSRTSMQICVAPLAVSE